MMPMKLTMEKPSGTEMSWGHTVADGYVAREAKSGAFLSGGMRNYGSERSGQTYVTSVAMLLIHDMRLETILQPKTLPCTAEGW